MQVPASIGRRICGAAILTSPQQKGEYPRLESAQRRVFWPRYETNCKDALAAYTVKKYATRTGVVPLMGRESQGHSASMVNGAASKTSGSFVSTFGETDKKEVGLGGRQNRHGPSKKSTQTTLPVQCLFCKLGDIKDQTPPSGKVVQRARRLDSKFKLFKCRIRTISDG